MCQQTTLLGTGVKSVRIWSLGILKGIGADGRDGSQPGYHERLIEQETRMSPPAHHKEVARYLRDVMPGDANVTLYRDNAGKRPIPIGQFGASGSPFFSTVGAFDDPKEIPAGDYEFAACGGLDWLPNAIASSIYWLKGRQVEEWPLVCEDVVRDNARSTYRHMAYVPSEVDLLLSTGQRIQWLLGVPITDKEISLAFDDIVQKARVKFPNWVFKDTE